MSMFAPPVSVQFVVNAARWVSGMQQVQSSTHKAMHAVIGMQGAVKDALQSASFAAMHSAVRVIDSISNVVESMAKLADEFELSMSRIEGMVGVARQQVVEWGEDILNMAPKLGKAPVDVAKGMYFITSAGVRGAKAMEILEATSKASAAGMGEVAVIARSVVGAVNAYAKTGLTGARAMDVLTQAVRDGAMEANELPHVLSRVMPIAAALGASFEDVAGTLAVMTRVGTPAAEAATAMRQLMAVAISPTEQGRNALGAIGMQYQDLRDMLKEEGGFFKFISELQGRFGEEGIEQFRAVIPNIRAFTGAMNLMAQKGEDVRGVLHRVRNSTGALDDAFKAFSDTNAYQFRRALFTTHAMFIQVGQALGDFLNPVMKQTSQVISDVTDWFKRLSPAMRQFVAVTLAASAAVPLFAISALLIKRMAAIVVPALGHMIMGIVGLGRAITFFPLNVLEMLIKGMYRLAVAPVIGMFAKFGTALKLVWKMAWTTGTALANLTNAFALVGAVIQGIIYLPLTLFKLFLFIPALAVTLAGLAAFAVPLLGVIALTTRWVKEVGGLSQAWEVVKQKLGEFWEWLRPVRVAFASFTDQLGKTLSNLWNGVEDVSGEAVAGLANAEFWERMRDQVRDFVYFMEYALVNSSDAWNVVYSLGRYQFIRLGNLVTYTFEQTYNWIKENWTTLWGILFDIAHGAVLALAAAIIPALRGSFLWVMRENADSLMAIHKRMMPEKMYQQWKEYYFGTDIDDQKALMKAQERAESALKKFQGIGGKAATLTPFTLGTRIEGDLEKRALKDYQKSLEGFEKFRDKKLDEAKVMPGLLPEPFVEDLANDWTNAGEQVGESFSSGVSKGMGKLDAVLAGSAEDLTRWAAYQEKVLFPLQERQEKYARSKMKMAEADRFAFRQGVGPIWSDINAAASNTPDMVRANLVSSFGGGGGDAGEAVELLKNIERTLRDIKRDRGLAPQLPDANLGG